MVLVRRLSCFARLKVLARSVRCACITMFQPQQLAFLYRLAVHSLLVDRCREVEMLLQGDISTLLERV